MSSIFIYSFVLGLISLNIIVYLYFKIHNINLPQTFAKSFSCFNIFNMMG